MRVTLALRTNPWICSWYRFFLRKKNEIASHKGASWIDTRIMCNECECPTAPESYFFSAAKSSLWQHIRQCGSAWGKEERSGGGEGEERERKQMRDEVKGVEGTLLCIQHPEVSIIPGRYGGNWEYKVKLNERRGLARSGRTWGSPSPHLQRPAAAEASEAADSQSRHFKFLFE